MIWEKVSELPQTPINQNILIIYGTCKPSCLRVDEAILTNDERAFGNRIGILNKRNTWMACRVTLRRILGACLQTDPADIVLHKNRFGRLFLAGSDLYFSISHTESSYLLSFNLGGKIGIDLEKLSGREDLPTLVDDVFSPFEADYCSNGGLTSNFLEIWTLKEAFLKAAGVGLVDHLRQVNVVGNDDNAIVLRGLNHHTFSCPGGETASIVYRNNQPINYIWLY